MLNYLLTLLQSGSNLTTYYNLNLSYTIAVDIVFDSVVGVVRTIMSLCFNDDGATKTENCSLPPFSGQIL